MLKYPLDDQDGPIQTGAGLVCPVYVPHTEQGDQKSTWMTKHWLSTQIILILILVGGQK